MIIYDTKNWIDSIWKIFLSIHWGRNYKRLLLAMTAIAIYSTAITYAYIEYINLQFHLDPFFFSLIGLILSMILVFRLNTSYNKWWEGRQLWGDLINHSRMLASYLGAKMDANDKNTRQRLASLISNFAFSLCGHLRNNLEVQTLDSGETILPADFEKTRHLPSAVSTLLYGFIHDLTSKGKLTETDILVAKTHIDSFVRVCGSCERIRNTPIPFSHSSFFKSFIIIYIISLPFGLVNDFMYFTIPGSLLISYAMLGIEIISEEIEEPFGYDPNDLPLNQMSRTIRRNALDILEIEEFRGQVEEQGRGPKHFRIIQ